MSLTKRQASALTEIIARTGQSGEALIAKGHSIQVLSALERLDLIVGEAPGLAGIVDYPTKAQMRWHPTPAGRRSAS